MPPLREREGDLPLLSQFFLEKYSQEFGKDVKKISAYAMDILSQYSFPGNVRELENIIERSVTLETSNIVLPESLTLSHFQKDKYKTSETRRQTDLTPEGIKLNEVMNNLEKNYIVKAIEMCHGSQQRVAELLGITFDSLRHRMKKLNI